jgi:ABC-2 type transport system permease protein
MGQILRYVAMLQRAYVRDRTALFFGFVFPLIFMGLFGVLNLGAFGRVNLGIVDEAGNADSARFIAGFRGIDALRVTTSTRDDQLGRLQAGDRDLVLVIPVDFRIASTPSGAAVPTLTLYENSAHPAEAAVGGAIVTQAIDRLSFAVTGTGPVVATKLEEVAGRNLRYVDFLTPGILGMTIMQLGISSVAFAFVVDRQRGVIRRIMATPISRRSYMAAHVLHRLLLAVVQVLILLGVAILAFKVTVVGSIWALLLVTILGAILFLCLGFAVTGVVATENGVPAVTQLVTLPQLFLSGVFFSRDAAPAFLRPVANILPLTYLNDALRDVSVTGKALTDIGPSLLGLGLWIAVSFVLAYRFFRLD